MMRCLATLTITLAYGLPALAEDWPQFLGPRRLNTTLETIAPWEKPPKVLWKQPIGEAHSSPVVAGGVVYAFFQPHGKAADALAAFDTQTGKKLWENSYERAAFTPPFGSGPRGTPTVADGRVFTLGSTGVLAAWDARTGKLTWKVDTLKTFGAKNLFFGISTSPTVVDGKVIVMVGGPEAGIVAFDCQTGKTAWKATQDSASYSSPIVTTLEGKKQLVFLTGSHVLGITPTGEVLWKYPFRDRLNESSTTPLQVDHAIIASSVTAGSVALDPPARGGVPKLLWKAPQLTCYFSTPVPVGKQLYMVNGAASLFNPSIVLRCVETETAKVLWEKPGIGRYHAAIIRTGNGKLLLLDDNGQLTLIAPSPEGYKELAKAKVCGPTWAHPAIADGRLFLRDEKELIALQLGK
ncbi:MAG: PQQ-like beta-propeller repeat protein [Bacteroidales bacterium]|nr:PQQ-like beta-propeller repeat protein [Bacteroidales bacterium]